MWENDFIMQWRSWGSCKASGLIRGEQDSSAHELLRSLAVALPSEHILVRRSVGGFLMPLATDCVMLSVLNFRLSWSRIHTWKCIWRWESRKVYPSVHVCTCRILLCVGLQWCHFRKPSSCDLNHRHWQHLARSTSIKTQLLKSV